MFGRVLNTPDVQFVPSFRNFPNLFLHEEKLVVNYFSRKFETSYKFQANILKYLKCSEAFTRGPHNIFEAFTRTFGILKLQNRVTKSSYPKRRQTSCY